MHSGILVPAAALAVLFGLQPTASVAQTRIGTASSVKPEASGSFGGTLSAGSGVHASETVRTGSAGQADLRFLDNSNMTVGPGSSVRLDKFTIRTGVPAAWPSKPRAAPSDLLRARKAKDHIASRPRPAPLAFAVEAL